MKEQFAYKVVFTLPDGTQYEYRVLGSSEAQAVQAAKLRAAQDKVPVFECRIEVKR